MTYNPNLQVDVSALQSGFAAYLSANQAIASGADRLLQFDTVIYNTDSYYDNTTFSFTPLIAGYYYLWVEITAGTINVSQTFYPKFYFNGVSVKTGLAAFNASASANSATSHTAWVILFNGSTDHSEFYVLNNTTTHNVNANSWCGARLLKAA